MCSGPLRVCDKVVIGFKRPSSGVIHFGIGLRVRLFTNFVEHLHQGALHGSVKYLLLALHFKIKGFKLLLPLGVIHCFWLLPIGAEQRVNTLYKVVRF